MAYFNYFIKCIIRNIAYKLCKPKVFLTVLLSVAILFGLKHFGYCAWTDGEIESCLDGLSTITNNQGVMISQLSSMGVDVTNIKQNLDSINSKLSDINSSTSNINSKLSTLINDINTLNTNILNIYNTLDANQRELIQELESNNQEVLEELQMLRAVLAGDSSEDNNIRVNSFNYARSVPPISEVYSNQTLNIQSGTSLAYTTFSYTFKENYTYNFTFNPSTSTSTSSSIYYTFDTISVPSNVYVYYLGTFSNQSTSFTVKFNTNTNITFIFSNPVAFSNSIGSWTINGEINGSINNLDNSINKGNQLQQERNDFLKDDNVDVDSSTLPSDTTQDITGDGFNNIFQQIYNTFTSGAAQDIVITIPFTNKSFTINANTVYGGANLGFVRTLIEAFWYFVISYFIVQDIGKKINKIKSGDIEHVQEDNIKEDLL